MSTPSLATKIASPRPIERTSVDRAKAQLLTWLAGRPEAEALLPSERSLATTLKMDRGTLRRAIKLAEADGHLAREGRRLVTAGHARPRADALVAKAIAVLVPPTPPGRSDAAWVRYVTLGATDAVREAGHHALTLNAGSLSGVDLDQLIASRPMGALLPEVPDDVPLIHRAAGALAAAGIPVVVYGDDPALRACDRVSSDHEAGSYALTRWLLAKGRRPVRLWTRGDDAWWLAQRSAGYERAMREAGHDVPPALPAPPPDAVCDSPEALDFVARKWVGFLIDALRAGPHATALMLTSDREAFYAAAACRLLGHEPGRDVLVAGYDNYWSLCDERRHSPDAPAATVDKHNERVGRVMLGLLLARIEKRLPDGPVLQVIAPELVVPNA